eukprot:364902-Chlamydomonas_euryale.AAC.16
MHSCSAGVLAGYKLYFFNEFLKNEASSDGVNGLTRASSYEYEDPLDYRNVSRSAMHLNALTSPARGTKYVKSACLVALWADKEHACVKGRGIRSPMGASYVAAVLNNIFSVFGITGILYAQKELVTAFFAFNAVQMHASNVLHYTRAHSRLPALVPRDGSVLHVRLRGGHPATLCPSTSSVDMRRPGQLLGGGWANDKTRRLGQLPGGGWANDKTRRLGQLPGGGWANDKTRQPDQLPGGGWANDKTRRLGQLLAGGWANDKTRRLGQLPAGGWANDKTRQPEQLLAGGWANDKTRRLGQLLAGGWANDKTRRPGRL